MVLRDTFLWGSDAGAKRRLSMGISNPIFEEIKDGSIPMITDGNLPLGTMSIVDDGTDRSKRTKKARADSPSLGSADSREESIWSQLGL
jgi:hypothetical protein